MHRHRLLLLAAATALPLAPALAAAPSAAALPPAAVRPSDVGAPPPMPSLHAGQTLRAGDSIVSPNGRYRASLVDGRLVVANRTGHRLWASPRTSPDAVLRVGRSGQLKLVSHHRNAWTAGTAGSGPQVVLRMRDDGSLALLGRGGLVWSDRHPNTCPHAPGRLLVVDVSRQAARACADGQQLRFTPVTTGAAALGDATPLGTWHVQAKMRNTTLHPAGGGAYRVKFWVPYNGAYGLHDSPWQTIPYGSPNYRRQGSHGCVHVPGPMMRWLFGWVRVGSTTVRVHA